MESRHPAVVPKARAGGGGSKRPPRAQRGAQARARDRAITATSTTGSAFQVIAASSLDRFKSNAARLSGEADAEVLHDARIALRQLRSAFSVFRPIVTDRRFERFRGELRWLSGTMNDGRDLDIVLARMKHPPASLTKARERAYGRAARAIASARTRRLTQGLDEWLAEGSWQRRAGAEQPADIFASGALDHLRRKLKKKGRHFRKLDDEALHEVRIAAKKLRYVAEFLSALFPEPEARHRAERFVRALRELQKRLGELHDAAFIPEVLERFDVPREDWPSLAHRKLLVERAATAFERSLGRERFWR